MREKLLFDDLWRFHPGEIPKERPPLTNTATSAPSAASPTAAFSATHMPTRSTPTGSSP